MDRGRQISLPPITAEPNVTGSKQEQLEIDNAALPENHNFNNRLHLKNIGRTACRLAVTCGLMTVPFAIAGNMINPAHTHIGPDNAEVQLTMDPVRNIDLGFPGSFIKDGPVFGPLGVHVSIKEIPGSEDSTAPKNGLGGEELTRWATLLSDSSKNESTVIKDMIKHGLKWALAGDLLVIGSYFALGSEQRRRFASIKDRLPKSNLARLALSGGLALSIVGGNFAWGSIAEASHNYPPVNRIFNGTPFEGYSVKGRLLQLLINEYGAPVFGFLKANSQFYDKVTKNLANAYKENLPPPANKNTTTALFISGADCDLGIFTQVLDEAVNLYKPALLLDAGDNAIGRSELDGACTSSEVFHSSGVDHITSPSSHNLDDSIQIERKQGFEILAGQTIDAHGLRIIGDVSPKLQSLGEGLTKRPGRNESEAQMGKRVGQKACADNSADIAMFNDRRAAEAAAAQGCLSLALASGDKQGLEYIGATPVLSAGSASGLEASSINLGIFSSIHRARHAGELTIIQFDKNTGEPVSYQVVTIKPDAGVKISPIQSL